MAETPPIKNVIYFTMQTYHQLRIACLIWVWSVRIFWWNLNRRQSFIWTYYTQVHSRIYPSLGPHGLTICLNFHVQYDYARGKDKCVSLRLFLTTTKNGLKTIYFSSIYCAIVYIDIILRGTKVLLGSVVKVDVLANNEFYPNLSADYPNHFAISDVRHIGCDVNVNGLRLSFIILIWRFWSG